MKCAALLPVASCGRYGPEARDAAATDLEGKVCVLQVDANLEDAAAWSGLGPAQAWAAAGVDSKGAANAVLVPFLLELVWAAAGLDFKGAEFVVGCWHSSCSCSWL